MPLPKLHCPHDDAHRDFRGHVHSFTRYGVALDPDWTIVQRDDAGDLADASSASDDAVYGATCDVEVWSKPRAITFSPLEGSVLVCDFSTGFRPPEVFEKRPCIVISKQRTNRRLCVVVPISSTESLGRNAIVVPITAWKYPFLRKDSWAKCHAPSTVSVSRLSMMRDPATGRGLDTRGTMIDAADLSAVRRGVARFVGATADPSA